MHVPFECGLYTYYFCELVCRKEQWLQLQEINLYSLNTLHCVVLTKGKSIILGKNKTIGNIRHRRELRTVKLKFTFSLFCCGSELSLQIHTLDAEYQKSGGFLKLHSLFISTFIIQVCVGSVVLSSQNLHSASEARREQSILELAVT